MLFGCVRVKQNLRSSGDSADTPGAQAGPAQRLKVISSFDVLVTSYPGAAAAAPEAATRAHRPARASL
jgi:hypothetical protein